MASILVQNLKSDSEAAQQATDNILRGELDENVVREDFRPSEQYAIHQALEEREKAAAETRMLSGKKQPSAKFAEGVGESRQRAAKPTGTSHATLKKIAKASTAAAQQSR